MALTSEQTPAAAPPFIHLELRPVPDDADGRSDLHVKAGNGIASETEIVGYLLLAIERLTGVSSDLYAAEIAIAQRAAREG